MTVDDNFSREHSTYRHPAMVDAFSNDDGHDGYDGRAGVSAGSEVAEAAGEWTA
jgi:hypothetical protein